MYIESNVSHYCVSDNVAIEKALSALNENKQKILFLVNDYGVLTGVFSDGDFRRWVVAATEINLNIPVVEIANKEFIYALESTSKYELARLFSEKISILPVLDPDGKLISVARPGKRSLSIGGFNLTEKGRCFIVAEIGNNHNGSLEEAKSLVDSAIESGADCVKFQMRNMDSLYVRSGNPEDVSADLGTQYVLDLLAKFQLSNQEFEDLFKYCRNKGVTALCTPFDKASVDVLESFNVEGYKVASADLTNHDLLEYLSAKGKPLIVSTGMSSEEEIVSSVDVLNRNGAKFVLLHCNSTYPTPFDSINLNYIGRLKEMVGDYVGYSGHERGWSVPVAAVALGAKVIEKHFTHDKTQEGNDHKVSLLPEEFRSMVDAIRSVEASLGTSLPRRVDQGELMNRENLAKSVVCAKSIAKGDVITAKHLKIVSPGKGLAPYFKKDLIGKVSVRDVEADEFFYKSDLEMRLISARKYNFNTPFGLPVRYHDLKGMVKGTNLKFVEFHLSYNDLSVDVDSVFDGECYKIDCLVHAPELFKGDHTLDLCSQDDDYRFRSIAELQSVIDVTNKIKKYFLNHNSDVPIVVNVGGFSENDFTSELEREHGLSRLLDSFSRLDTTGVELIPQTMPPYPWHFGGQRFHNLFVDPHKTAEWCKTNGYRICLDVSHTALACNYLDVDLYESLESLAPYTAHLHLADAAGTKEEGLQICEGDIDFQRVFSIMESRMKSATWLPEIWQGHKNSGEGFWRAFDRLEELSSVTKND